MAGNFILISALLLLKSSESISKQLSKNFFSQIQYQNSSPKTFFTKFNIKTALQKLFSPNSMSKQLSKNFFGQIRYQNSKNSFIVEISMQNSLLQNSYRQDRNIR